MLNESTKKSTIDIGYIAFSNFDVICYCNVAGHQNYFAIDENYGRLIISVMIDNVKTTKGKDDRKRQFRVCFRAEKVSPNATAGFEGGNSQGNERCT